MPVYLIYLSIFFGLPVLILAGIKWQVILKYRRTLFWCFGFVYTLGALWDWMSVKTGVWRYDSAKTLGLWVAGLPAEEFVGFYLLSPVLIFALVLFISDAMQRKGRS